MTIISFNPKAHPRDLQGQFREAVAKLRIGDGVRLPDGIVVQNTGGEYDIKKGEYLVSRGIDGVGEAAYTALHESATSDNPKSLGGSERHAGVSEAVETPAERRLRNAHEALGRMDVAVNNDARVSALEERDEAAKAVEQEREQDNIWSGAEPQSLAKMTLEEIAAELDELGDVEFERPLTYREQRRVREISSLHPVLQHEAAGSKPGSGAVVDSPSLPINSVAFDTHLRLARRDRKRGVIKAGDKGAAVLNLQHVLSGLGYDIEADGDFGPITKKALRDFQEDKGVSVDGIVGPQTLRAFRHAEPKNRGELSIDAMEYTVDPDTRGARQSASKATDRLARQRARRDQSKSTVAPKGPHGGTVSSSGDEVASTTTGPIGTTDPNQDPNNPLSNNPQAVQNQNFEDAHPRGPGGVFIAKGATGAQVVQSQRKLNDKGARLKVDGDFGRRTEGAVREFQQRKGLTVDGIIGPQTIKALGMKRRRLTI